MVRRPGVGTKVLGGVLLALSAVAGCAAPQARPSGGRTAHPPAPVATALAPRSTADPHAASASRAPNLGARGVAVLVSGAAVRGKAEYPLKGGIVGGGTLAVAVDCQGPGRLTVAVKAAGASFTVPCGSGKVQPLLDEIGFGSGRRRATLVFTPEGARTVWSFAAGWDPHPPERR
ncbi:hypothetical protein ACFV3R_21015 [Streptomyces sp. NPDC059740]|uniref:hypothetical protein n=1 Tax=Streptomyces sp. NPDC059740 TaxID=3346926 RepID=UPI0036696585